MNPIVIKWALSHPWTSTLVVETVEPGLRATVLLSAECPSSLLTKANRHRILEESCQMAKFDPFLSLDCARVEGVGAQSKERKGSNFAA